MRLRLGWLQVDSLTSEESRERSDLVQAGSQLKEAFPDGKWIGTSTALGVLAREGWTVEEVAAFSDTWPGLPRRFLPALLNLAAQLRRNGITDIDDIIAWSHALVYSDPKNKPIPNKKVMSDLYEVGLAGDLANAAPLYARAAGSYQAALAILLAGKGIEDIKGGQP